MGRQQGEYPSLKRKQLLLRRRVEPQKLTVKVRVERGFIKREGGVSRLVVAWVQ